MKIINITSSHKRFDTRIYQKICLSAANSGHEVTLVVADGKGNQNSNKINIIDIGSSPIRFIRFVINPVKIFKKVRRFKNCIFHLHDPELLIISSFLRKKNTKVIYDMHENLHIQILFKKWIFGGDKIRKIISLFSILYQKLFINKVDFLIVVQSIMKDKYFYMNKKITVINNFAKPLKNVINKKFENHKYNIIYAGELSDERGFSNMINLINNLPEEYILNIAGRANVDKQKIFKETNNKKIIFHGFLSKKDLYLLYEKCSIGLIMFNNVGQYNMSYSSKLFEYMQFGLTILLPNFGEWVDFNKKYKVGFNIDPINTEECSKKIVSLKQKDLKSFFKSNKETQHKKFNWNREYLRLEKVYKSLNKCL